MRIFLLFIPIWLAALSTSKCSEQTIAIKQGFDVFDEPIAIEASGYMDFVRKSKLFVDNSLLIHDIHRSINASAYFFLGPDKWGKSANIDMIRAFYDDGQHDKQHRERFFENSEIITDDGSLEKLQKPLLISSVPFENSTFVKKNMGKYAVICLSFTNAVGENASVVERNIKIALTNAYREQGVEFLNTLSLKSSLWLLFTTVAKRNPERKIWIIVEDYDNPVLNLLQNKNIQTRETFDIYNTLKSLIPEVLENNDLLSDSEKRVQLQGIIVTGRFSFHYHDQSFKAAVSTKNFYILQKSEPEDQYFGIKEENVKRLFELNKIDENLAQRAYKWYQYEIGNQKFYNPLSIAKFLKEKYLKPYSKEHECKETIRNVIRSQPFLIQTILALFSKKTVTIEKSAPLLECDIEYEPWLSNIFGEKKKTDCVPKIADGKRFFTYLFQEGYLSTVDNTNQAKLANNEMRKQLAKHLMNFYKLKYRVDSKLLRNVTEALRKMKQAEMHQAVLIERRLTALYKSAAGKTEEHIRSIFNRVLLLLQAESEFQTEVYYDKSFGADYVTVNQESKKGLIIQLCPNSTAEEALKSAEQYQNAFQNFKFLNIKKLVGINISPEMEAKVLVKTIK